MTSGFSTQFVSAMCAVEPAEWNALARTEPPFMRHEFLLALEQSGSISVENGWQPHHALTRANNGRLVAAAPLYIKTHSWGEFVFDWAWADAYERHGLRYYPKLVSAAPYTPATSNKLIAVDQASSQALKQAVTQHATAANYSSWHLHFLPAGSPANPDTGWVRREDCQFHWRNRDYEDFDAFLATFSSKKRKNVKRERRRIVESGLRFDWLCGEDMSPQDWSDAYELTRTTFLLRGREPYLRPAFFAATSKALPGVLRVVFAQLGEMRVAAAIFLQSQERLYGRYWGSLDNFHSLHFETCYYQGIEHCIREGLQVFEPGTQGEHKVSRGFEPTTTISDHYLVNPEFAAAIEQHSDMERDSVQRYMAEVKRHSPFRKQGPTL